MLRQTNRRRGFSPIAMLTVVSIVLICVAIVVPSCLPVHRTSDELGPIRAIKTIHEAEVQYKSQFGRYACTLKEIGPPAGGPASPSGADLIGNQLSSGEIGGYRFTLTCSAGGYVITAVSSFTFGTSGIRSFYSD
jgi:type IV pilus assembly protein PilA